MSFLVSGLVLAAGSSQRFGSPKALAKFGSKTALERSVSVAVQAGCNPVTTVLGKDAKVVQEQHAELDCKFVVNLDYSLPQLISIQTGIRSIPKDREGVALFLVDHPLIQVDTVKFLMKKFFECRNKIVRPVYKERGGHPTIFPCSIFKEILELPQDQSMRKLFLTNERVVNVSVLDEMVIQDFDTKEEYIELVRKGKFS